VRLFDSVSMDLVSSLQLHEFEQPMSITSGGIFCAVSVFTIRRVCSNRGLCLLYLCAAVLQDDDQEYIVVGTSYMLEEEEEPSKGRIIVLAVQQSSVGGDAMSGVSPTTVVLSVSLFLVPPFTHRHRGSCYLYPYPP
jgi:hypothetical protein